MKNFKFGLFCIFAFIFWKLVFSTDFAKDTFKKAITPSHQPEISIEDIAQDVAAHINANKQAMLDEMTVSLNAIAVGRNIRLEHVIRVKKGLPPKKIKVWLDASRAEIVPKSCTVNAKNPAFDRGLSYTFAYSNTYGEKLGDIFVDKATCKGLKL